MLALLMENTCGHFPLLPYLFWDASLEVQCVVSVASFALSSCILFFYILFMFMSDV